MVRSNFRRRYNIVFEFVLNENGLLEKRTHISCKPKTNAKLFEFSQGLSNTDIIGIIGK